MIVRSSVVALSAAAVAAVSLSIVAAVVAADTSGSVAARPGVAVAVAPATDPSPSPVYRFVADYSIARQACVNAGQAGVDNGEWDAFICRPTRGGLDTFWSLWVTP